jgi:nascent polypeptide-associated complex subunit alpha
MFPGGMNPNSAQMRQAMKRMGVAQEELEAKSVTIALEDGTALFFDHPNVSKVKMMGQEAFQIAGEYEEKASDETAGAPSEIDEEDLATVMAQTGATKEQARKALEESQGDLAKAILALTPEK